MVSLGCDADKHFIGPLNVVAQVVGRGHDVFNAGIPESADRLTGPFRIVFKDEAYGSLSLEYQAILDAACTQVNNWTTQGEFLFASS